MPKEDKEKKRFKAVTEEVSPSLPEEKSENIEAPVEEKAEDKPQETENIDIVDEKPMLSVRETDNYSGEPKAEKGMFLKIFLVTFFATLMAFLLAGGVYVYLNGTKSLDGLTNETSKTPEPQASSQPEATGTPEANVDVSTYKISVLNGNGGIGVAGAAKTVIESGGFKVTNTGNAESFDFEETEISAKSGVPASVVAKLKDTLSSKYTVKIADSLPTTSSYDITVTVGSK